ncbi:FAD-dependent oxidoreductase [Salinisphaera orenii]|uniref:FAD-dependent oxidoreductase n=1 Tax=Salinisphaera orenii TaxID=856731 RepID=UPI001618C4EC|nr:FAD-dependent oxidoreductase [Salinisphaera orenii]
MVDYEDKGPENNSINRRRRKLLVSTGAGLLSGIAGIAAVPAVRAEKSMKWERKADVLVVGSGAAGTAAALAAAQAGSTVLILEKMPFSGGTTRKSAGVFWIPNNPYLRQKGVNDDREGALRYMIRLAYPDLYRPDHKTMGISPDAFAQLETFYLNGSRVIQALMANTTLKISPWHYKPDQVWPDYHAHLPEDEVEVGRSLVTDMSDNPESAFWPAAGGDGNALLTKLRAGFEGKPVEVLLDHKVKSLVKNDGGRVAGLVVEDPDAGLVKFQARKGVVFASGGFTHNKAMADCFLRGRVWGGCAMPGSTGDFVPIAAGVGAMFGNMNNAWWCQIPVELAVRRRSVPYNVWVPPGDSMLQVNRYGRRFVNEKIAYNERTQVHFYWDPVRLEYPNLLGIMIWDGRSHKAYAGYDPIPGPDASLPEYIIRAATLDELATKVATHLQLLEEHTGALKLDASFKRNLVGEIEQFNQFARSGKDERFGRGETPNENAWQTVWLQKPTNPYPNKTLYPISEKGPYYAVLLGAGTLDTKGGAVIDSRSRVLNTEGVPIPGLYAAGNCVASPAHQAYWGGGGTIGPALTFGYIAGEQVAGAQSYDA